MTDAEKRRKIQSFVNDWQNRGDEKSDTQFYWQELLSVFAEEPSRRRFVCEKRVSVNGSTKYIDIYIPETRVLIEQKSLGIPLDKEAVSSDYQLLSPYGQAKRYNDYLPYSEKARWIVTCNFAELWIYNMESRVPEKELVKIPLEKLPDQYPLLEFLLDKRIGKVDPELTLSLRAGELVGNIYDAFLRQYHNPEAPDSQRSLNVLCVRLVFCMYAEDALLFGRYKRFEDFVRATSADRLRPALQALFSVLDTPEEERDPYLEDELAAFPYCNGGLFADRNIEIPKITEEIKTVILEAAHFDWSPISPTIFGAVFESTLNPVTRHEGGMHYTSVENIHKVIDPLFLDELQAELAEIKALKTDATRNRRLVEFQEKLSGLRFLDPAAGSGNFLTESYLCLRRMENEVLELLNRNQVALGDALGAVKVKISQFYGIEINDFAVTVAKTALWISESQMLRETQQVVHIREEFLPLKTQAHIVEGNALRMDWEEVVPKSELNYIMGNPPFMGASKMTAEQKKDAVAIFGKGKRVNSIDYVGAWYYLSAMYMQGTNIKAAFVSTNSITQGEQVFPLWNNLLNQYHITLTFAYRTFKWASESNDVAAVHCVIIGFQIGDFRGRKRIYDNKTVIESEHINPYLIDAPDVLIDNASSSISNELRITTGNKPSDGGNLILSQEERDALIKDVSIASCIKFYIGSKDFINGGEKRYCLWLKNVPPATYHKNSKFPK